MSSIGLIDYQKPETTTTITLSNKLTIRSPRLTTTKHCQNELRRQGCTDSGPARECLLVGTTNQRRRDEQHDVLCLAPSQTE
mmetsp:Transcript_30642/g.69232  ORF Transcript_30642/g.69232 Transcript_30642/m.69232 type:complete len:82 (+) Transcript_30642:14-259(+)